MPDDTSKRPPELEYERPVGITRRAFRLLLLLTFVNTLLLGTSLMGPQHWQAVRNAYTGWKERRAQAQREQAQRAAQQAARVFRFPENHVAYTEVPEEAMKLDSEGLSYRPLATRVSNSHSGLPPPGWQAPVIAQPLVALATGEIKLHDEGLLFLHERTSPDGTAALVKVVIWANHAFAAKHHGNGTVDVTTFHLSKSRAVLATAFAPVAKNDLDEKRKFVLKLILPDMDSTPVATMKRPAGRESSTTQPVPIEPGNQLRLFGGSPDPADPSHFTIPYELDGQPGVIDGWLKDDALVLRPRQGRAIASPGDPAWELLPATNPVTGPDQEAQLLAIQEQCFTYIIPAGTVTYTEDPALAAALAGQREQYATISPRPAPPQNWVPPIARREPAFWTALRELSATFTVGYETTKPYPMLFLHERTTPSGQRRVVVMQWVAEQSWGGAEISRLLAGRVHAPAGRGVAATLIDHVQVRVRLPAPDAIRGRMTGKGAHVLQRPEPLTLFAGEPDPNDGSHFTIPYTIGETTGVIDGWVTDDQLILKPRLGERTSVQGQQTWVLGAAAPADASTAPRPLPQ